MFYYILVFGILFCVIISLLYYKFYKKFATFDGPTYIVDNDENVHHINLLNNSKYLGLDCEWVSKKKKFDIEKKVSLVQISNGNICILVRLHLLSKMPTNLLNLLQSTNNYKFGVGISADVAKLFRDHMIEVNNWIDLRNVSKNTFDENKLGLNKDGLSGLTSHYIGKPLDKNLKIILSNWECDILSNDQITYAATDAWCANIIFDKILQNEIKKDINLWLNSFIEKNYSKKKIQDKIITPKNNNNKIKVHPKGKRLHKLFDNVSMYSPENSKLAVISQGKANFYLKNKLAQKIPNNNSIKLLFNPKGSGFFSDQEKRFYLDANRSHCYICNEENENDLLKFYIVHRNYRKYMPNKYKVHTIHDIGVLCVKCKCTAEQLYFNKAITMAKRLGFIETKPDKMKTKIFKTAKVIHSYEYSDKKMNIPEKIIYDHKKVLISHLNKNDDHIFSKEELCTIIKNNTQINDDDLYKFTMDKVDDIDKFIKTWREFFVLKLKPQHLPTDWSIDFPCVTHSEHVVPK